MLSLANTQLDQVLNLQNQVIFPIQIERIIPQSVNTLLFSLIFFCLSLTKIEVICLSLERDESLFSPIYLSLCTYF